MKKTKSYSIRRRITIQFCLFSLLLSVLFSCVNFFSLYITEDTFIERTIREEAAHLSQQFEQTGIWPTPRKSNMTLHQSTETFPDEVRTVYVEEPNRKEFYGLEGRHYHLYPIKNHPGYYLLGEVSQQLVVRNLRPALLTTLAIPTLLMTLTAFFIGWRLAKHTIKPLTDLVELVEGVSPEQLPKNFAHDYPGNEIGVLAQTLDHSMQRINDFVEREQHFTRDASHELRTPIAIIKNASELLKNEITQDDKSADLLQRISRANLQMEQTVSTLLSLAREENAAAPATPVKLLPLVEKTIIQHAWLLDHKDVEVDVDISASATVTITPGILQILVANLISNSFQYTITGQVNISFQDGRFCVNDTGPGIEDTIKDKLLEPMVKGSESQGFGIGLSIVKRLCERHDLTLEIESQDCGVAVSIGFC